MHNYREAVINAISGNEEAYRYLYDNTAQSVYVFLLHETGNKETADELIAKTYNEAWGRLGEMTEAPEIFPEWILNIAKGIAGLDLAEDATMLVSGESVVADGAHAYANFAGNLTPGAAGGFSGAAGTGISPNAANAGLSPNMANVSGNANMAGIHSPGGQGLAGGANGRNYLGGYSSQNAPGGMPGQSAQGIGPNESGISQSGFQRTGFGENAGDGGVHQTGLSGQSSGSGVSGGDASHAANAGRRVGSEVGRSPASGGSPGTHSAMSGSKAGIEGSKSAVSGGKAGAEGSKSAVSGSKAGAGGSKVAAAGGKAGATGVKTAFLSTVAGKVVLGVGIAVAATTITIGGYFAAKKLNDKKKSGEDSVEVASAEIVTEDVTGALTESDVTSEAVTEAATEAATEEVNAEDALREYLEAMLIPNYGIYDPSQTTYDRTPLLCEYSYIYNNSTHQLEPSVKYDSIGDESNIKVHGPNLSGIYFAEICDLDGDGTKELFVLRSDEAIPQEEWDLIKRYTIRAEVYVNTLDEVILAKGETLEIWDDMYNTFWKDDQRGSFSPDKKNIIDYMALSTVNGVQYLLIEKGGWYDTDGDYYGIIISLKDFSRVRAFAYRGYAGEPAQIMNVTYPDGKVQNESIPEGSDWDTEYDLSSQNMINRGWIGADNEWIFSYLGGSVNDFQRRYIFERDDAGSDQNTPEQKPTEAANTDWKADYLETIQAFEDSEEYSSEYVTIVKSYNLIYINNDDIPELVCQYKPENDQASNNAIVYTWKDGRVIELGSCSEYFVACMYYPKENYVNAGGGKSEAGARWDSCVWQMNESGDGIIKTTYISSRYDLDKYSSASEAANDNALSSDKVEWFEYKYVDGQYIRVGEDEFPQFTSSPESVFGTMTRSEIEDKLK